MSTHSTATRKPKCQNRPTVERLRQLETYRQIKAEAVLAESIEDAAIWPVIRKNEQGESVFVNVKYTELTASEIRSAYNNAFYTYSEGA